MTPQEHDDYVPVPAADTREPWNRSLCPECGRLSTRRRMDVNAMAARSVLYACQQGHEWRTTWARP